jgi:hypothetical protein
MLLDYEVQLHESDLFGQNSVLMLAKFGCAGNAQVFVGVTGLDREIGPSKRRKAMTSRAAIMLDCTPAGEPATHSGVPYKWMT